MPDLVLLVRHGETEWSKAGKHTSITDLPLTSAGEQAANALRSRFDSIKVDHVLSSPRQRALHTAQRATGRSDVTVVEQLVEWNYGEYEGRTTHDIREKDQADWDLWEHGSPDGESPAQVTERVHELFAMLDTLEGTVACFAHGHILRAIGALWVSDSVQLGRQLLCDTGGISTLTHARDGRSIKSWNVLG